VGKIDKRQLPEVVWAAPVVDPEDMVEPATPGERALCNLMESTFEIKRSADADFFNKLGLTSLDCAALVAEAHAIDIQIGGTGFAWQTRQSKRPRRFLGRHALLQGWRWGDSGRRLGCHHGDDSGGICVDDTVRVVVDSYVEVADHRKIQNRHVRRGQLVRCLVVACAWLHHFQQCVHLAGISQYFCHQLVLSMSGHEDWQGDPHRHDSHPGTSQTSRIVW